MASFKGLVFVKHGRVGSRSEGPDYYLQASNGDFLLNFKEREPWKPDYYLEFYCRRMVEVTGEKEDTIIRVQGINEILGTNIPK